jgi:glucan phosphoethanolaminetransferase (alkaline phosphatase superfamily)
MVEAPKHSRRRFWSSVLTAFVTLTWLSLMAFQSYSSGRWVINGLFVTFFFGLWLVDRRLRPKALPASPGPLQFSLSKLLMVLANVAVVMAIFAWFDREHRRVVEKSNQRVEQIMKRSQTIDELDAIGIQATADELEYVGWQPEDDIAAVRAKLGR